MKQTILGWVAVLAVATPLLAFGQSAQPAQPTKPAAAPTLKFQSAFDDYKPYRDIEPGDWRGLNDVVGTAALKSGAQQAVTAAPGAPAPAPRATPVAPAGAKAMKGMHPGMQGSDHHKMHGGKP